MSGQSVPSAALENMNLILSARRFQAKSATADSSGKLSFNLRESPPRLTFSIAEGDDSGREIKAIYRMVDEKLQIAFSNAAEFPDDFDSTAGNEVVLLDYELVQKYDASGRPKKDRGPLSAESAGPGGS